MKRRFCSLFLDNMPFSYDAEAGLFISSTALSDERLRLEEVRRRGMVVSLYEVAMVRGIPYVYVERDGAMYRVGDWRQRLGPDELEPEERGGPKLTYLYGEAFRNAMEAELNGAGRGRDEDRGR